MPKKIACVRFNNLKLHMRRTLSVICIAVLIIVGLCYGNQLLIRKDSYKKYEPFLNSDQEFDVLFFGSSHVYYGVSPLFLYQNYGITSYNLATHSSFIPNNYYCLKEILRILKEERRQLPEIIVMDIYVGNPEAASHLHGVWDSFPLSDSKIKMSNELVQEKDRAAMLFPFLIYHNRWNELVRDDFQPEIYKLYGMYEKNYLLCYPDKEIISNPSDKSEVDKKTIDYLNRIREECEAAGIEIIFIHIPYSYRPDLQRVANGICQYENVQGVLCINYMNMDTEIDYDIDLCDPGHLNPAGMGIMTDEIGKLLSEYGITDHRGEPDNWQWEQAYKEYIDFRISKIKEIQDVKPYLMAINDPDLKSTVQIREGLMSDIQIAKLIKRLGADCLKT